MKNPQQTPKQLGYRMPAEWTPHEATWLSWPHNRDTWPEQLEVIKDVWARMVGAISPGERVFLLVNDAAEKKEAADRLVRFGARMENVHFLEIPTVDVWMRDYGPTFVTRKGAAPLAFNDWIFNGWGNKYESYADDDRVAKAIGGLFNLPVFTHDIVLEGGSIEVNGAGTCLTTEQCLLNPNRNPHLSRGELEIFLKDNLGVDHILWLGDGIVGDDTDGHIDDIARFVDAETIVCAVEDDPHDENYRPLQENLERLKGLRDQNGSKLDVVPLPMPGKIGYAGTRLPASYANFYIANVAVLVPTYDHANDRRACGIIGELFPDRRIVPIPSTEVVIGLGAMHCVTQQQPRS
ncbi:MAG TPA: agmatine deiminase family protein [Verrucomicrobiae bacterium]|jgi:agmatine deiminase|nr:agmatine deiminase family protein [Verrucomicrobiae bacterium]